MIVNVVTPVCVFIVSSSQDCTVYDMEEKILEVVSLWGGVPFTPWPSLSTSAWFGVCLCFCVCVNRWICWAQQHPLPVLDNFLLVAVVSRGLNGRKFASSLSSVAPKSFCLRFTAAVGLCLLRFPSTWVQTNYLRMTSALVFWCLRSFMSWREAEECVNLCCVTSNIFGRMYRGKLAPPPASCLCYHHATRDLSLCLLGKLCMNTGT